MVICSNHKLLVGTRNRETITSLVYSKEVYCLLAAVRHSVDLYFNLNHHHYFVLNNGNFPGNFGIRFPRNFPGVRNCGI